LISWRIIAPLPNPTSEAIHSMEASLPTSSSSALLTLLLGAFCLRRRPA
jgi:hypothetical protein